MACPYTGNSLILPGRLRRRVGLLQYGPLDSYRYFDALETADHRCHGYGIEFDFASWF